MENIAPLIIESDGTRRLGTTRQLDENWVIEIPDKNFRYLRIDNSIRFQIGESLIAIESPFKLTLDGELHECDIDDPKSLVPLLKLWPDTLESAVVDPGATLTLSFARGARISVASDPHGEAWEISGSGTFLVICDLNPGSISIWE